MLGMCPCMCVVVLIYFIFNSKSQFCSNYSFGWLVIFYSRNYVLISGLSVCNPGNCHCFFIFLIQDVLGIVAKLSECIALRGGNILGADIFVPEKNQVFYSRRSVSHHYLLIMFTSEQHTFCWLSNLQNVKQAILVHHFTTKL